MTRSRIYGQTGAVRQREQPDLKNDGEEEVVPLQTGRRRLISANCHGCALSEVFLTVKLSKQETCLFQDELRASGEFTCLPEAVSRFPVGLLSSDSGSLTDVVLLKTPGPSVH